MLLSKVMKLKYEMPGGNGILEQSKEVLLSPEDTRMWCEHLYQVHRNRVNGAKKKTSAKQKSQAKGKGKSHQKGKSHSSEMDKCLQCGQEDPPGNVPSDANGAIDWICCDGCNKWCHALCSGVHVFDIHESDDWLCLACSDNGWSVNFYYFTNSTKPDHLSLFCNPLRTFARKFSNTNFFWKLLPL